MRADRPLLTCSTDLGPLRLLLAVPDAIEVDFIAEPKRLFREAVSEAWIGSEHIIGLEPNVTVKPRTTTMLALISLFSISSTSVHCESYVVESPLGIFTAGFVSVFQCASTDFDGLV